MEEPCYNCAFLGDNVIRCKDCKREGGIYYHYKELTELETKIVNAILGEIRTEQQKSVDSQKKRKRSKKQT